MAAEVRPGHAGLWRRTHASRPHVVKNIPRGARRVAELEVGSIRQSNSCQTQPLQLRSDTQGESCERPGLELPDAPVEARTRHPENIDAVIEQHAAIAAGGLLTIDEE